MASRRQRFAQRRKAVGYTQESFAERLRVDRNTVARWEAGTTEPQPWMRPRIARALGVSVDELDRLLTGEVQQPGYPVEPFLGFGGSGRADKTLGPLVHPPSTGTFGDELEALELAQRIEASEIGSATIAKLKLGQQVDLESTEMVPWAGADLAKAPGHGTSRRLLFSGGRFFDGAAVDVHLRSGSVAGDAVVLTDNELEQLESHPPQLLPSLVVGAVETGEAPQLFVLDGRAVRRRLASRVPGQLGLTIPCSYILDDLTFGILWATANLDASLLADDSALAQARRGLRAYDRLKASAVSREVAPDLTGVSLRWLGSEYCARHILRNLEECSGAPFFWTCEQRGEEASAWLLFGHKYAYLRRAGRRFARTASGSPVRAFCIPEDAVADSPAWERLLVFLAAALMESVGIRVAVCTEPDLSKMEGFVLGSGRRAIIANWVRSDGIWHVDTITRSSRVRELADVAGHARARSVVEAPTPSGRLDALSSHLNLDGRWLRRRCRQLARHGCGGFARARSRLLSVEGLDAACRFVGSLDAGDPSL